MISSQTFVGDATTATPRAAVHRLASGVVPMAGASLICQLGLLAVTVPLYQWLGLSLAWGTTAVPHVVTLAILLVVWANLRLVPERRQSAVLPDLILAVFLLILLTNILSPAQYAAVALKRPLIDRWLASADAALGIHVPSLVEWTRAHPKVNLLLTLSYHSLLLQFVLTPVAAALLLRDRGRLWEYVFHFHCCLIVTLAALAAFPAACAFTYYGFESTLNQTRFINQFQALRDGSLSVIRFDDLEGLISMPSFHAAGAMMVTWTFRGHRRWLLPVAVLNVGLLAATVMSGAHYFVDVLAAGVVFVASLSVYRLFGSRLIPSGE